MSNIDPTMKPNLRPSKAPETASDSAIELESTFSATHDPFIDLQTQISELSFKIVSHLTALGDGTGEMIQEALGLLSQYAIANSILPIKQTLQNLAGQKGVWSEATLNEVSRYATHSLRYQRLPIASIHNPLLWSYSTLACLLLYRKQSSTSLARPEHHLSTRQLKEIKNALLEGQQFQGLSHELSAPVTLLAQLKSSLLQSKTFYQEGFDTFKMNHLNELKQKKKQADRERRIRDIEALKAQTIYLSLIIFDGQTAVSAAPDYAYDSCQYEGYTFAIAEKANIEQQKKEYLSQCALVMYPKSGFEGPILPLTNELVEKIQASLPKEILEALELNLGELNFRYSIEDGKTFRWRVYFGNDLCWGANLDYKPGIHTGDEAIWWYWVGGAHLQASSLAASNEKFLEYAENNRSAYVRSNEVLSCQNALAKEACDKVSNIAKELIESIHKEIRLLYLFEVKQLLKLDTTSAFGQAMGHYFLNVRQVKAMLALSAVGEHQNGESQVYRSMQVNMPPASHEAMVDYLNDNKESFMTGFELFKKMDAFLVDCQTHLPQILEQARASYQVMVNNVLHHGTEFIEDYSPTAKQVSSDVLAEIRDEAPQQGPHAGSDLAALAIIKGIPNDTPSQETDSEAQPSPQEPVYEWIDEVPEVVDLYTNLSITSDSLSIVKAQMGKLSMAIVFHFGKDEAGNIRNLRKALALLKEYREANRMQPVKRALHVALQPMAAGQYNYSGERTEELVNLVFFLIKDTTNPCVKPDSVAELLTFIKKTNKCSSMMGSNTVPDNDTLLQWTGSSQSAIWADFHVNELRLLAATRLPPGSVRQDPIGNPYLWAYATSALLLHYRKEFSTSGDKLRISMKAIRTIQEAHVEGQHIQELIQQLRNPALYESLLQQLESAYQRFLVSYMEGANAFADHHFSEATARHQQAEKLRGEKDANALKAHVIHSSLIIFDGKSVLSAQSGYTYNSRQYAGYTFALARNEKIKEQKIAFLKRCSLVVYPAKGFDGPILPLTPEALKNIHEALPKGVLEAVQLNLDELKFNYHMRAGKPSYFLVYFGDKLCCKLSISYKPHVYTGAEGIWWAWVGEDELYKVSSIGCSDTAFQELVKKSRGISILPRIEALKTLDGYNQATNVEREQASGHAEKLVESFKHAWIKTNFDKEVRQTMRLDKKNPFAQDLTEFLATLTCLKALIALAWHDEYEKQDSELTAFLKEDTETHLLDEMIADNKKILTATMDAFLTKYKNGVHQLLKQDKLTHYNLLESALDQCTGFINEYLPTVRLNPLEEFAHITQSLVDAFTEDNSEGFENEPRVSALLAQLAETQNESKRLILSQELKNNKVKIVANRVHLDKVAADPTMITGRGAAAMALPTQNSPLLMQIKVVSEQLLNVGMQVAGLAGFEAASGAATTLGLGASLLGAAAAISDIFRQHSDPVVPMMMSVLTELTNQHQQLLAEMAWRQVDLKAEIGEVGLEIVTKFANFDAKVETIQAVSAFISQRMLTEGLVSQYQLNSITQALSQVNHLLIDKTVNDVLDTTSKPIYRIVYSGSNGYIDRITVAELSSQLLTSIKETSKRVEVAGASRVPDLLTMSQWKIAGQPGLWANFHINELRMLVSQKVPSAEILVGSVCNPLLWAYSTLAQILLYRRQYANSLDPHANRITLPELDNVQEALWEGQKIKKLFIGLRDPQVGKYVLGQLESSLTQLKQHYEASELAIHDKQRAEIKLQRKEAFREQQAREVNLLAAQEINRSGIEFDSKGVVPPSESGREFAGGGMTCFTARKSIINKQKDNFFREPGVLVYPEVMSLQPIFPFPVLPLGPKLLAKIYEALPKVILEALELNLGELTFSYSLETDNQFSLVIYFKDNACLEISAEYKARNVFNTYQEATWWYWAGGAEFTSMSMGTYEYNGIAAYTKIFENYCNENIMAFESSMAKMPSLVGCNKVSAHEYIKVLHLAEQMLAVKKEQMQIQANLELRHAVKSDTDSPFGQAITAYFAHFKCLKAYLALCLNETGIDFYSSLQVPELPASREEMVAYLDKNRSKSGLTLLENMNVYLGLIQKYLVEAQKDATLSNDSLIDSVLKEASSFIEEYAPTTVRENFVIPFGPYDSEDTKDKKLETVTESTAMLMDLMMSMKEELGHLNVSSIEKEQYWSATRSRVATFCDAHPHLLAESGIGPARLMAARGDSPVFGQRVVASVENGVVIDDASVSSSL